MYDDDDCDFLNIAFILLMVIQIVLMALAVVGVIHSWIIVFAPSLSVIGAYMAMFITAMVYDLVNAGMYSEDDENEEEDRRC